MNKAQSMLTAVINRQIARGEPVIVGIPSPLWELRGNAIRSNKPVTIRVRAESHKWAMHAASRRNMVVRDCVLIDEKHA